MIEPGTTYRITVLELDPETQEFKEREARISGTELERIRVQGMIPLETDNCLRFITPADLEAARPEEP